MSTIKKPPVDVVIVGFGWTGAIMGMELTETGLSVLALERGEQRDTYPDFAYPRIADELTYGIRMKLKQEMAQRNRHRAPYASGFRRALSSAWILFARQRRWRCWRPLERHALARPARRSENAYHGEGKVR